MSSSSAPIESDRLHGVLRRYWGYDTFRPRQEAVIRSILAGRDVAVVMPTGGGKSLCYQVPPLVAGGTAIVISPLIALMQDQAAQLAQMGIASAVLNSTQPYPEQRRVMVEAVKGAYRLIYLSPERLAREDTVGWLQRIPPALFAIDEAHCISEWGHEFRPEYRQLSRLREAFPDVPIAAFTASATQQVRHDILRQLKLRTPDKYIASFHRENLRYVVRAADDREQRRMLVKAAQANTEGSLIVYAPTIARVEETADWLANQGIDAVPYHGQMENDLRRRNQEMWMNDEARVLVGTIAFGLGINKPAVRAVIHLSMPKSIEQYYQEAGRAGRDGLPAECVLFWQKRDVGLLAHFIESTKDAAERERAWQRYHIMRRYVESAMCRHRQICVHFGETPKWEKCDNCDVCGSAPEWLAGVEAPAPAKRVREPKAPVGVDAGLREYLREWRRRVAEKNGMPAYVVLHDTTIEDLCRKRPTRIEELTGIYGIGQSKMERYGRDLIAALRAYDSGARAQAPEKSSKSPAEETIELLRAGRTFEDIAQIRNRKVQSVANLVGDLVERAVLEFDPAWIPAGRQAVIEEACVRVGTERLKAIKEALPEEITYVDIRLVVASLRRKTE